MNQKKAKGLRRKAFNLWSTDFKKRVSLRKVYQMLKKEHKNVKS